MLFDDGIEPAAVGLDFGKTYNPKTDPKLRELSQTSDAVARVRVTTVTSRQDGPTSSYQLGLAPVETISGNLPAGELTVPVDPTNESYGIVKNFENGLVGRPFIAFVRSFSNESGDPDVHFHLTQDSPEVKTAITNAIALGELK